MDGNGFGNLVPLLIWGIFVIAAIRRWTKRRPPPLPVDRTAAPLPPPAEPLVRRRLAAVPAARPIAPPVLPATARVTIVPSMAETLPAEAAAAFPGLDLSLPGADGPGSPATPRRRIRTAGGGPPLGSPAWAANAIVAAEILGPPVSLRSGATLGAPHAF